MKVCFTFGWGKRRGVAVHDNDDAHSNRPLRFVGRGLKTLRAAGCSEMRCEFRSTGPSATDGGTGAAQQSRRLVG